MPKQLPRLLSLPPVPDPVLFLARELDWDAASTEIARELETRGLPPLTTVRTLPFILGVSHSLLNRIRRVPQNFYRPFTIPKRSGGDRLINSPRVVLKLPQRWIHDHILLNLTPSPIVKGFADGTGIFENARVHVGQRNLLQTDLVDFFGSVTRESVVRVFADAGFPAPVTQQLCDLVYFNGLPQGAPTSPILSNLIGRDLDAALVRFGDERDAKVSRYADDITFSSSTHRFSGADVVALREILQKHGFDLNERKTRIIGLGYRHVITGVSISSRPQYPRDKRRDWRVLFHRVSLSPPDFIGQQRRLVGIAAAVQQYDAPLAAKYREIVARIPEA